MLSPTIPSNPVRKKQQNVPVYGIVMLGIEEAIQEVRKTAVVKG